MIILDGWKRMLLGGTIGSSVCAGLKVADILQDRYHDHWLLAEEKPMKIDDVNRGRIVIDV